MKFRRGDRTPLVYPAFGCSGSAQRANDLALGLDREGIAEMSGIAGATASSRDWR